MDFEEGGEEGMIECFSAGFNEMVCGFPAVKGY